MLIVSAIDYNQTRHFRVSPDFRTQEFDYQNKRKNQSNRTKPVTEYISKSYINRVVKLLLLDRKVMKKHSSIKSNFYWFKRFKMYEMCENDPKKRQQYSKLNCLYGIHSNFDRRYSLTGYSEAHYHRRIFMRLFRPLQPNICCAQACDTSQENRTYKLAMICERDRSVFFF